MEAKPGSICRFCICWERGFICFRKRDEMKVNRNFVSNFLIGKI